MPNNIAVSITADVADLTAKRAILSAELKTATADLNAFAKTANTSGSTDALRASMLKSADAVARTRAQIHLLDTEMKGVGGGQASSFNTMFGGLKNAGLQEATGKLGAFGGALGALGPYGIAAAAGLTAMAFAADKARKAAEWAEQLKRSASTLGFTTTQLQEFDFALNAMGIDVDKGREALSGLEKTIGLVESGLARSMQTKAFTDGLKISPDDLRGWGTLEEQLPHILDALAKLDPEERAAISQRLKIDPEVVTSMIDARGRLSELIATAHQYGIIVSADVIDKSAESAGQMRLWKSIIDGELRVAFIDLAPTIAGAAQAVAGAARDFTDFEKGVQHVLTPIANFIGKVESAIPKTDGLRASLGGLLDPIKQLINPLSMLTDLLGKIGHDDRAAADKANAIKDVPSASTPKPVALSAGKAKGGGNDIVEQWREQLQQMEVASGDFFKDNTAKELAFWQGKLALTKAGSKQWLAVQTEIYGASKTLAHQAYDEHLAALDAELEAAKGSWGKERALWAEKLAVVKKANGEISTAYANALREEEAAEREHEANLVRIASEGAQRGLEALRSNLATARAIREADNRTAEAQINEKGKSSGLLGEVSAATQIAALHKQTAAQALADNSAEIAAADQVMQAEIDAATKGSDAYNKAVADKRLADLKFYNQHRELENQLVNEEKQDLQKIRAAWHSVVDPMVSTTGAQIKGLIEGTETWGKALENVGEEALELVIEAIERMIEGWIVGLLTGQATQKATAVSSVISYAGVAGAAGVASMAGAPFPIDLTAPEFGASMAEAALGFASMASLDVGTNVVPRDMPAFIHAGERVIPAADNRRLMARLGEGASPGGRGDIHFHHAPTFNGVKDAQEASQRSDREMRKWIKGQVRNNVLKRR